jgi:hypothetical protein
VGKGETILYKNTIGLKQQMQDAGCKVTDNNEILLFKASVVVSFSKISIYIQC